jgi:DNA damage-binding protein 1
MNRVGNQIELYSIFASSQQPLRLQKRLANNGNILAMFTLDNKPELMVLISDEYTLTVLNAKDLLLASNNRLSPRYSVSLKQRFGKVLISSFINSYHPPSNVVCVHFYQGALQFVQFNGVTGAPVVRSVRVPDRNIVHVELYTGARNSLCLAMLSKNNNNIPSSTSGASSSASMNLLQLKTSRVDERSFELSGEFEVNVKESDVSFLAASPGNYEGFFSFGSHGGSISYRNPQTVHSVGEVPQFQSAVESCSRIGGDSLIFSDLQGNFFILTVTDTQNNVIQNFIVKCLGKQAVTSCFASAKDFLFIGSPYGNSCLMKLSADHSQLQRLDSLQNIAPITDFAYVDDNCPQLVACSGAFEHSHMSVIKNGMGVSMLAVAEIEKCSKVFALQFPSHKSAYISLSYPEHTDLLVLNHDGELEAVDMCGDYETSEFTVATFTLPPSGKSTLSVQVLSTRISLLQTPADTFVKLAEWVPPSGHKIFQAASVDNIVLLALDRSTSILLRLDCESGYSIKEIDHQTFDMEISCISFYNGLAAFCFWNTPKLELFDIGGADNHFQYRCSIDIGSSVVARSVLIHNFSSSFSCVIVALGDGKVLIFEILDKTLTLVKHINSGSLPPQLTALPSGDVFVSSERSQLVSFDPLLRKIKLNSVNYDSLLAVIPFDSSPMEESLLLLTDKSLGFGRLNRSQRLQIRSIPIEKQARRIVYLSSVNMLVALCFAWKVPGQHQYFIDLFDFETMQLLDSKALPADQCGNCLSIFNGEHILVGTGQNDKDRREPQGGSISMFRVSGKTLKQVATMCVKGAVYSVNCLDDLRFLCGINTELHLMKIENFDIKSISKLSGFVSVLYLDVFEGKYIAVGDIMKSVAVVELTATNSLKLLARDPKVSWISSLKIVARRDNELTLVASDCDRNIRILTYTPGSSHLSTVASIHSGEFINRFQSGILVHDSQSSYRSNALSTIFVTVSGAVGIVYSIPGEDFEMMKELTKALCGQKNNVEMSIDSLLIEWRKAVNFIDGDFVERFLDLSDQDRLEVVQKCESAGRSVNDIVTVLEEIQRLH